MGAEEERLKQIVDEQEEEDDDDDASVNNNNNNNIPITTTQEFLLTKRHFNIAMSKARKSVSEDDLILFEEFTDKQKAGRGEAATNFKFKEDGNDGDSSASLEEDIPDDL